MKYYFALPDYLEDMLRQLKRQEMNLANLTDAEAVEKIFQDRILLNEDYIRYGPDPDDERDNRNTIEAEERGENLKSEIGGV